MPVRLPTSAVPIELNSTSSGCAPLATGTVEPARGWSWPQGDSVNPVKLGPTAPELATYTRFPCTAMLTGVGPSEETTPPGTSWRLPSQPTRSTEILVTACVYGEQVAAIAAELERSLGRQAGTGPDPLARKGEPGMAERDPSAWRSNAPIVLVPAVLSSR